MPDYKHIYVLRKERHLSQEQVARKLNITQSAYGKLERGQTRLTTDRVYQLADIFKVDPNEILHPKGEKKIKDAIKYTKEIFELQREIIAIFKHQIESLIWSNYAGIIINYDGVQGVYEELPDFVLEMLKEDYNIHSREDYDGSDQCPKPYYNTEEEEYDAFKKLISDTDIYYLFKNGLYDFEEDAAFFRCWKKYLNEKGKILETTYPASLKLDSNIIRTYLRTINASDLYQSSEI